MSSTVQATKSAITLKGSSAIICEYLNYSINSILFQRGIYPAESFHTTQHYGLTMLMSKDDKIEHFLKNVLVQAEEWVSSNQVEKISLIITNAQTREVLECWEFKVENEVTKKENGTGPGGDVDKSDPKNPISNKELSRIQTEIRDVMRQISATITYLPLLDMICSFDVLIHTIDGCEVPANFNEAEDVKIQNAQAVELKSFSTGLHKMHTIVNYKMN